MNSFLGWAGAVCTAAAGCALVHIPVGKTGVGKVFRLVTAALLICVTLSPLKDLLADFELPSFSEGETAGNVVEETAIQQLERATETAILTEVNKALASHQLKAEKAEVSMDILEDGSISITDVLLYIPKGNALHRSWAAQIASTRLAMPVRVEFLNGG